MVMAAMAVEDSAFMVESAIGDVMSRRGDDGGMVVGW
jgi:hypothetical protein